MGENRIWEKEFGGGGGQQKEKKHKLGSNQKGLEKVWCNLTG